MNDYLKKYNVVLETIGPVFIGSGKEINKKEYILRRNEIWVMDIPRLYGFMKQRGLLNKFEKFFLDEYKKDLVFFLKENNIRTEEVLDCVKYREMQSETSLERGTRTTVLEFVKDPYGLPYIPGSSVKGMLRTILLAGEIIDNRGEFADARINLERSIRRGGNKNVFLKNDQRNIETIAFNKLKRNEKRPDDAVNDIMAGLRISDSVPLSLENLVLCQRLEYHMDGTEKSLNVLRECIRPGTKIEFTLTIDETIFPYTKEDIIESVAKFSDNYNKVFRTKYPKISTGKEDTVYLGGGVGFVSKTSVYPLFGQSAGVDAIVDIFNNTKVPQNHKHYKDKQLGVAPHILKTTRFEGKMYQMGECQWKFV